MAVLWMVVGGLVFLVGLSVFSALMLAKRTDRMVVSEEDEDQAAPALRVRFPDQVFRTRNA